MVICDFHRLIISCSADEHCPYQLPSSDLFNHNGDRCLFYLLFNILRPIFVCAAASLFFVWLLSGHVSALYIIAGSMHEF